MTVDQYDEAARLGVLDDPRVELINGLMVRKKAKSPIHSSTLGVLDEALRPLIPKSWYVRIGRPIRLPTYDEPDLAVLRGKPGDYRSRHPGPEDVAMVVEVSETSLRIDRGDKLRAYARAGIAHYWIINLVDRRIEAYREPGPNGYGASTTHDRSSEAPVVIDGVELGRIAVGEVVADDDAEV
ncbi:MAG: Uma2 family endonuclease [Paludisphaera borealis]|uniref:Uma2 family endonuclease n=1 Tax=Paludisphaera borealis TaxID=1387353 RepID=UPI00284997AC|nr:Uma2 family endonuclease [Paludisphaera borealis]MDR3618466.1 Uma2 family endonuclease [Paludisphaera borealis]